MSEITLFSCPEIRSILVWATFNAIPIVSAIGIIFAHWLLAVKIMTSRTDD